MTAEASNIFPLYDESAQSTSSRNLCMECNVDMGECNPRQLCGKTKCDMNNFNKFNIDFIGTTTMAPSMINFSQQLENYTTSFLSNENFEYMSTTAKSTPEDEVIDWEDLPLNMVFRVHKILPIQTKWGSQVILELRNQESVEFKVWSPSNVYKNLKSGMKLNESSDVYIKSLGQKEIKSSSGNKKRYYDFEIVYLLQ